MTTKFVVLASALISMVVNSSRYWPDTAESVRSIPGEHEVR